MIRNIAISLCLLANLWTPAFSQQANKELVVVASGGAFEKALVKDFYEPFSKASGVKVTSVPSAFGEQNAKIKAMSDMRAVTWDVVTSYPITHITLKQYLEPLDCARLTNLAKHAVKGTCLNNAVARTLGGGVIAYSPKAFGGKKPKGWADFWDVKNFPGPRTLPNVGNPWEVLVPALLADGVPKDKLFPLDLDRAFKKMDEIKPHVALWWKTSDQSVNAMRSGDVVMGWLFDGRALALQSEGANIEMQFNEGVRVPVYWSILKGSKNKDAAYSFLNYFLTRPEAHAEFTKAVGYGTPNMESWRVLDVQISRNLASNPLNWTQMVGMDYQYLAQHGDEIITRWNKWISQ